MKKSNLLKMICIPLLAIGIMTTSLQPVTASENKNKSIATLQQEFNLKPETRVPDNTIVYKFDTTEQAEIFLNDLKANEDNGSIDIYSLASDDEIKTGVINLSHKKISKSNFKKFNNGLDETNNNEKKSIRTVNSAPIRNISVADYTTVEQGSKKININGLYMNVDATATVKWNSTVGNYYSDCTSVTSYLSGVYFGNAWTQTSYSKSISNDGKKLGVTVNGKYDYYLLINTTLTSWAGKSASYYFYWTL